MPMGQKTPAQIAAAIRNLEIARMARQGRGAGPSAAFKSNLARTQSMAKTAKTAGMRKYYAGEASSMKKGRAWTAAKDAYNSLKKHGDKFGFKPKF